MMKNNVECVNLNGESLRVVDVYNISREFHCAQMDSEQLNSVQQAYDFLHDKINSEEEIYGVTVAFGHNANKLIPRSKFNTVSNNLVSYLNCGLGSYFSASVSRGTIAARINSLIKGHSGISPQTLRTMLELLNHRIHPLIPKIGSCGASGDLVPLSYLATALRGDGIVEYQGQHLTSREVFAQLGLSPVELQEKEGLSLVNGTSLMTAIACLTHVGLQDIVLLSEALTVFCAEVFQGNLESFSSQIHSVKPHPGQMKSAENMVKFSQSSELLRNNNHLKEYFKEQRQNHKKQQQRQSQSFRIDNLIQLPYSIRTVPQVYGYTRDVLAFTQNIIETELNSVSDNPLLFAKENLVLHGGNFQGSHISAVGDSQAKELCIIAKVQHSQLDRLINPAYNGDFPGGLIPEKSGIGGLSGLQICMSSMIPRLMLNSYPIANSSVITDGGNQDFVSMGAFSAQRAYESLQYSQYCSAILLFALCQAAEFVKPEKLSAASAALYEHVRSKAAFLNKDKPIRDEIETLSEEINNRNIIKILERQL